MGFLLTPLTYKRFLMISFVFLSYFNTHDVRWKSYRQVQDHYGGSDTPIGTVQCPLRVESLPFYLKPVEPLVRLLFFFPCRDNG